ncbi:MAG: hypothetical protein JWP01_1984 [Myxococcales bacterium]|nr:hypothetical protein [Myxococcales bacterium]
MTRTLLVTLTCGLAACGADLEASPERIRTAKLSPATELCVTRGKAAIGDPVREPTMRATARGSVGDAAAVDFIYRGDTEAVRELASGQPRRQLGLKLRAMNGCNLVYVMWRLDPTPKLEVSVKLNRGARDHSECGADGYTKVRATRSWKLPVLASGDQHTLRAAIAGDQLTAWVDDRVAWRGTLPASVRGLHGPAGLRSDNLAFDLVSISAELADRAAPPAACPTASD